MTVAGTRGKPRLIDPEALGKLKGVALRARVVADGILQGLHKSPHEGASIEFSEHKEYAPGDEIKHVDWKAFGRLDKYYVKKFEHETNLQAYMVIDASGSMSYGAAGKLTKFEYASVFATTVAYLLLKQQDAVGLIKFDESVTEVIPPRSRMTHLSTIADVLEKSKVKKGTNLDVALKSVVDHMKKRGMVLLFSDFFGEDAGAFKTLKALVARGHDVTAVQVLDGDELDFPFKEMTLFEGLETDMKLLVEPQLVRKEFLARMAAHQAKIKRLCLESQAGYFLADTREPPGHLVLRWLRERRQGSQRRGKDF